jgi:tetratricopeptide (TPR) repeat protein
VRLAAVVCAAFVLSAGCTSEPTAPQATLPLPAVFLPDLSRMEKGVQQQLSDQYRSLKSKTDDRNTPASDLAEAYGQMGNLLLATDSFEAAQACYLHAQSLAPGDVRWPYYLGHVDMARADLVDAATSFERALALRPDDVAALVWLGGVRLDLGQPELAEPLFAKALSLQPATVAAMFGLGRTALAKRDFRAAVDRFEQALSADPRATIVHYPLALAYRGLGDTARAEEHLRQRGSLEVGPPDPLMVQLRGLIQSGVSEENEGIRALDAGDFGKAAEHFRRGIELAPASPSLHHKLGTALSLSGDRRGAAAQFEEAIPVSRSPTTASACCWRPPADTGRRPIVSRRPCATSRTTSTRGSGSERCFSGPGVPTLRWPSTRASSRSIRVWPKRGSGTRRHSPSSGASKKPAGVSPRAPHFTRIAVNSPTRWSGCRPHLTAKTEERSKGSKRSFGPI